MRKGFSFPSAISALLSDVRKSHVLPWRLEHVEVGQRLLCWAICWPKSSGDSVGFVSQLCCVQALPCVCQASRHWCLAFPPCLPPSPSELFAETGAFDFFSFWINSWGLNSFPGYFFKISDKKNKKFVSKTKPLKLGANEMFPLFSSSPFLFPNLILV